MMRGTPYPPPFLQSDQLYNDDLHNGFLLLISPWGVGEGLKECQSKEVWTDAFPLHPQTLAFLAKY